MLESLELSLGSSYQHLSLLLKPNTLVKKFLNLAERYISKCASFSFPLPFSSTPIPKRIYILSPVLVLLSQLYFPFYHSINTFQYPTYFTYLSFLLFMLCLFPLEQPLWRQGHLPVSFTDVSQVPRIMLACSRHSEIFVKQMNKWKTNSQDEQAQHRELLWQWWPSSVQYHSGGCIHTMLYYSELKGN